MELPNRLAADVAVVREGRAVDVIADGTRFYVVLPDVKIGDHYTPSSSDLMVIADYQYPLSALDMFYTEPHVRCVETNAWPQNADTFEPHIDRTWQRWSWHYDWNPSAHSLLTHLEVCFDRLARGC